MSTATVKRWIGFPRLGKDLTSLNTESSSILMCRDPYREGQMGVSTRMMSQLRGKTAPIIITFMIKNLNAEKIRNVKISRTEIIDGSTLESAESKVKLFFFLGYPWGTVTQSKTYVPYENNLILKPRSISNSRTVSYTGTSGEDRIFTVTFDPHDELPDAGFGYNGSSGTIQDEQQIMIVYPTASGDTHVAGFLYQYDTDSRMFMREWTKYPTTYAGSKIISVLLNDDTWITPTATYDGRTNIGLMLPDTDYGLKVIQPYAMNSEFKFSDPNNADYEVILADGVGNPVTEVETEPLTLALAVNDVSSITGSEMYQFTLNLSWEEVT